MITPQNIRIHEFIGLKAKVKESLSFPYGKLSGVVVDETKNTLVLVGSDGVEKRVPKRGVLFTFTLPDGTATDVSGDSIAFRPYERPKKIRR